MNDSDSKYPLLVEIGLEEIPSNVIAATLQQFSEASRRVLSSAMIPFSDPQVFATPRRLILYIPDLKPKQETTTAFVVGPPKRAAFDASGTPTVAATGFARSQGVPLSEIQVRDAETLGPTAKGKKGAYLVYKKVRPGEESASLLVKIIPEIIARLTFPRSMRWNQTGIAFVRPLRSLLAIYAGKVIPFSYAGVHSSDQASGHHMMAPATFRVSDFSGYQEELRRRFVLIDPNERLRLIASQMKSLAKEKQGILDLSDQTLLWGAANTIEYPTAICGDFDPLFLEIPKEIVITAMKEHQGYFPLFSQEGALLSHFITICNIKTKDMSRIKKGNERVLRARLVDAKFYFEQDRKMRLADRVPSLKRVTFLEKLGTLYEKVERIKTLSVFFAKEMHCSEEDIKDVEQAAYLCKADLLTGVVREFPSLQGIIGRSYAVFEKESVWTARAIEEHYMPRLSGSQLPETRMGQILAIADKLDTIVGCFGIGLIPSGSEDPYALRRQGMGIIQILLNVPQLHEFSLKYTIAHAIKQYEDQNKFHIADLDKKIVPFFKRRLDAYLQGRGIRYDLRAAVLSKELDKPWLILACAEALEKFSKQPIFESLITIYRRADRILPEHFDGKISEITLSNTAEKKLYERYNTVNEDLQNLWPKRSYETILEKLATLYEPLNQFFEAVLVMDKDEEVRHKRLSLLLAVSSLFKTFCDFSKIVEEGSLKKHITK